VKCALLALNGDKDVQVPCRENLQGIKAALKAAGNDDCTTRAMADLNHMFQTAVTGAPSEYVQIAETVAPAALQTVTDWALKKTSR